MRMAVSWIPFNDYHGTAQAPFHVAFCRVSGQLSLRYNLTSNGRGIPLSGGNPPIPDPATNTAQTTLVLSQLPVGATYTLIVWSVSQAGVASATQTTYTWSVIASAPDVIAASRPDSNSGR